MNTTSISNFTCPHTVRILRNLGLEPDPWQIEFLEAGASTAVAQLLLAGGQIDGRGYARV